MDEVKRKLNLTMKITDSVVKLSIIVSGYEQNEAPATVRKFNQWVDETRELLMDNFDGSRVERFDSLTKPTIDNVTPEEMNETSRSHAEYLQDLIQETVE